MTLPEFFSYTATGLSGGALAAVVNWARSRDERKAKRLALAENIAITLLRDQLGELRAEVGRLRTEVDALRLEKQDALKLLNAATLEIVHLKDEVNDELRAQGKGERYDLVRPRTA